MIRSVVIALAGLSIAGCLGSSAHDVTPPYIPPITPIGQTRITPNAPSIAYHSGLIQSTRSVIGDSQTFLEVWSHAFGTAPPPEVDFKRELVILAALGEKGSGGYGIEVKSVGLQAGDLVIAVVSTVPGRNCAVSAELTQPVDMVKIPLRLAATRFVEQTVVRNCGH